MRRSYQWTWVGLLAAALAPGVALAQAAAPATHTVRSGDTLWDLARRSRMRPLVEFYLTRNPDGRYAPEAREMLQALPRIGDPDEPPESICES